MKAKTTCLATFMIVCSLSGGQLCVRADEPNPAFCPDLHEHKALLEDGLRYYDQNESRRTERSGSFSLSPLITAPNYSNVYDADSEFSEKDLDSYKIASTTDAFDLYVLAAKCLFYAKYAKAYEIYSLLQKSREAKSEAVRPALISLQALTKLLCGCDDPLIPKHGPIPEGDFPYLEAGTADKQEIVQSNLLKKIMQSSARAENPDWLAALELYKISIQLHTPEYPAPISDEITLALLLEWNGQVKESKDVLLTTQDMYFKDNSSLKIETKDARLLNEAILGFCKRRNDIEFARLMESRISPTDNQITFQLLAFYGAGHYCNDAAQLLRKIANNFDATKYTTNDMTLKGIGAAIPCLSDSDLPTVKTLVDSELIFHNPRDSQYLLPVLKKADERGWHAFPVSAYRAYTRAPSVPGESPEILSVFADFFVEVRNYNLALAALNRSLGAVKRRANAWMSLDDKFLAASKLKDQSSAPWVMHTATGEETVKEATSLVDHLSKLIAQRECLSVAADLDATAAKLEDRDLFAKAEQLYRESVQIKKKNLGAKHIETLSSLVALARILSLQDKFTEAASTYEEALSIYNANKTFRNRSYGTMLESYAQMLVRANKSAQADKIYAEARAFYGTRVKG